MQQQSAIDIRIVLFFTVWHRRTKPHWLHRVAKSVFAFRYTVSVPVPCSCHASLHHVTMEPCLIHTPYREGRRAFPYRNCTLLELPYLESRTRLHVKSSTSKYHNTLRQPYVMHSTAPRSEARLAIGPFSSESFSPRISKVWSNWR